MAIKDVPSWMRSYGIPAKLYVKEKKAIYAAENFYKSDTYAERLLTMDESDFAIWTLSSKLETQ